MQVQRPSQCFIFRSRDLGDIQVQCMIPYKFKGVASALYSTDRTLKIIEHENDGYNTQLSKVNVGNGVL